MVVLVEAEVVEQILATQLSNAIHDKVETLSDALELAAHGNLTQVLTVFPPGLGVVFIAQIC